MPRSKGTAKTGGRQKGSPNKATQAIKDAYAALLSDNLETLQSDLEQLKPIERLRYLLDLSEYIIPKLARTEADITSDGEKISLSSLTDAELIQLRNLEAKARNGKEADL